MSVNMKIDVDEVWPELLRVTEIADEVEIDVEEAMNNIVQLPLTEAVPFIQAELVVVHTPEE